MASISVSSVWPDWHVEELLGEGSFGKVYRASRDELGHVSFAAVKVIEIPSGDHEVFDLASSGMDNLSIRSYFEKRAQGILDEIVLMESLKGSPNVVAIEDYKLVEHEDDVGWTVLIRMELLEPVGEYFRKIGPPSQEETAQLGIDVCKALEHCHDKGIVHRDLKPENIFHGEYAYKLGDFGIARRLTAGASLASTKAGSGDYMAPEVYRNEKYGKLVDIYSLGIVLYRYLNGGRAPFLPATGMFGPDDRDEALSRRMRGEGVPLPGMADGELASIVVRACEADPSQRWRSATQMRVALEGWLSKQKGSGREGLVYSEPEPAPKPEPIHKTQLVLYPNGAEDCCPAYCSAPPEKGIVLPSVTDYRKPGFEAVGWCKDPGGSGTVFRPGSTYLVEEADDSLYVKWEKSEDPPSGGEFGSSSSDGRESGLGGRFRKASDKSKSKPISKGKSPVPNGDEGQKKKKLIIALLASVAAIAAVCILVAVGVFGRSANYTVMYLEAKTGSEIRASDSRSATEGASITESAPDIDGYAFSNCWVNGQTDWVADGNEVEVKLDTSNGATCQVMFYYSAWVDYTVRYLVFGSDTEIAPAETGRAIDGETVTRTAPTITDYELFTASPQKLVVSSDGNNEITFYYKKDANPSNLSNSTKEDLNSLGKTAARLQDKQVLPDSNTKVYTSSELEEMSDYDLFIARNEMFARHGCEFENEVLKKYFEGLSWYEATVPYGTYTGDILNSVEKKNAETMLSIERKRDSPYLEL